MLNLLVIAALLTQGPESVSQYRDCGAYCSGLVLEIHGIAAPEFREIQGAVKTTEEGLCSLEDIQGFLSNAGLEASAFDPRFEPRAISAAIVPIRNAVGDGVRYHFCVAKPTTDGKYCLYSPPYETKVVEWRDIADYSGNVGLLCGGVGRFDQALDASGPVLAAVALVLLMAAAAVRLVKARGPLVSIVASSLLLQVLLFSSCADASASGGVLWDKGGASGPRVVTPGNNDIKAALRNETGRPVVVTAVKVSCGCLAVSVKAGDVLDVGEVREVVLTVSVEPGEHRSLGLTLSFDEHSSLSVAYDVEGRGSDSFRFPNLMGLGDVRIGEQITVLYRGAIDRPLADAMGCRDPAADVRFNVDDGGALRVGAIECREQDGVVAIAFPITLSPADVGRGLAEGSLLVGKYNRRVSIDWVGVLPCAVEPSQFVLDKQGRRATAVIRNGARLVRGMSPSSEGISVEQRSEGDDLVVTVSCNAEWARGVGVGHVEIALATGAIFKLPVVVNL